MDLILDSAIADLAKMEAAACYVKGVDLVRRQLVFLALRILALFVAAFGIVALPLAVVACLPWPSAAKLAAVFFLGVLYMTFPAVLFCRSLSERRWMEFSRADHFVKEALKKN